MDVSHFRLVIILAIVNPTEPKSCTQLLHDGFTSIGVYTINPDGDKPMQVLCDKLDSFQRHFYRSVDVYLGWESYKNGFGDQRLTLKFGHSASA